MGASAGPSLQGIGRGGASNLVLEMDAHDAKSYPGEPTTSLLDNPISSWSDNGAVTTTSNVMFGGELFVRKCVNTATGSSSPGLWPIDGGTTVLASTQYTLSIRGFQNVTTGGGSAYLYVQNQSLGSDLLWTGAAFPNEEEYFSDPSQQIASSTFTTPAGTTLIRVGVLFAGMSTTGGIFYIKDLQLEQKGYATPFVREGKGGTGTYNARPVSVNLMIHGDVGTGQSFSDSSPSGHTITANGDVTHSGGQSKFSGGSIYYDDSSDYLSIPASTDWVFSGDFTIDFWCYIDSSQSSNYSHFFTLTSQSVMSFKYQLSGNLLYLYTGNTDITCTIDLENAWHHVALVRSGTGSNNLQIFVDGISQVSASKNDTWGNATGTAYIGWGWATEWFKGYMDEMRVTQGTALWTSNFTPPTRRNLSAPVVDRSGSDNGGNFATTDMTDVATYRVGEVIRPIASATWDFDGTDDAISIKSDAFDLKCFTVAIKQGGVHAGPFPAVPGQVNVGMNIGGNGFNGIIMGSWTSSMDDETLSLWGYASTNPSGSGATYIKDVIEVGWHIFTFNWNGSDYDIWVDGTKRITFARGGGSGHSGLLSGVTAIYPGRSLGWSTDYFEGNIVFFRAYDKSLTDQQIIENFHAKRNDLNIANWRNRDIVKDGLQLWLDAQESASYSGSGSTWYDLTSNNYDVTLASSPLWNNTGYFDFNGTTQWGSHAFASAIGTQTYFTCEVWVNWNGKTGWNTIFDMPNDDYLVGLHNGTFYFYDPTHNSGFTLTSGTWYQLVVAYDSTGTSYFYVNGASVSSFTNTITKAPGSFSVGAGWGPNENFGGKIAIINWYNRQLSASEIEQNFIVRRQRFGI